MTTQRNAIAFDPSRRGGRSCVRNLRISVGDVLGWLAMGQTTDRSLADYPALSRHDIHNCLAYAAGRETHEVRLTAAA